MTTNWSQKIKEIILFAAAIAGIIGIYGPVKDIARDMHAVRNDVNQIKNREEAFAILYPANSTIVSQEEYVSGHIPANTRKHIFLFVTPIKTQTAIIQKDNVKIMGDGWSGFVRFGSAAVGSNQTFALRAIATDLSYAEVQENTSPRDAIMSEVIVKRQEGASR